MAEILKHVGQYGGKPCVIVFREIPNEPENCLVVISESLDERVHDDLMETVSSAEAQSTGDVSSVMARRQMTNGEQLLNYLHFNKKLQKVPVSMVTLTPTPAQSVPLAEVNAEIKKITNDPVAPVTDPTHLREDNPATSQVNPSTAPADVPADNPAQGMLLQAELMEQDAENLLAESRAKRQEAYDLDPSLKPKRGPGRPPKDAD
jgi:hypothetical protein|tara:strand:- start:3366 stop:3980 length:615 start_codon:yes stop_codon:yes gene_type:complete